MILLGLGVSILLLAGILARGLGRHANAGAVVFRWGSLAGCLCGIGAAVSQLGGAATVPGWSPTGAAFALDALSSWFVIIILGVGATAAAYGVRYLAVGHLSGRAGTAHLLLAILLSALVGVVTAHTVVAFLASWEIMAITAYLLVVTEHERTEVRRAGLVYLILTHLSTIALLGMFAAWTGGATNASFPELASAAAAGRVPVALVLLLALVGFGIKAGTVPGHFWLPGAHAAAPSHISAILSGVMLKSGIYGLLRVLSLIGPPPAWWGWTVLLLGLASAILGVLWALAQHDLKRLLAYHSVENIGIILMGLGLGALGTTFHHPALAVLGFTGALLHTLNHALFKSLLFLGAGAVVRASGTSKIDQLGGLARAMPGTAWAFLVGAVAIVGLPPLNGFVSEWVIFRGLFAAGGTSGALRVASATAVGLALTGALALACFTKLHGVLFLGTQRGGTPVEPRADRGLVGPQLVLAAACITIGLLPFLVIPAALRAAAVVLRAPIAAAEVAEISGMAGGISLLALGLVGLAIVIWQLRLFGRRLRVVSLGTTWACAFPVASGRMQYTASSYAANLLTNFRPFPGIERAAGPGFFHVHASDPVIDRLGRPVWRWVQGAAQQLRRHQTSRIRRYLLYVILVLVGFLFYLWAVATR